MKFHNGDSLTGADVKFSLERFLAPAATHYDAVALRRVVDSVELKDDYTVVLRLKAPQFELPQGFEARSGITAVMPKKYIEERGVDYFQKNPVGSGPFKFVSITPGARLVIEANEDYWDKNRVPQFRTATLDVLTEESAILAQLKTGELDLAAINLDSVDALKSAGLKVYQHQTGSQMGWNVLYNRDNPSVNAIGDVRVRKALSLAVNRDELAKSLFRGYATPCALSGAEPTSTFYDANVLKPDPFAPEGAKKLLAEAGRPNPTITIFDLNFSALASQYGQALAEYWRKVGGNTKIRI